MCNDTYQMTWLTKVLIKEISSLGGEVLFTCRPMDGFRDTDPHKLNNTEQMLIELLNDLMAEQSGQSNS